MAKSSDDRGLWSGAISFGLVNIPVRVVTARQDKDIHFNLLNKKNNAPIGYKQYDKSSGKEVSRKDIIKGYEYETGKFVLMGEADFLKANPKATKTIDIEDFVSLGEIEILFFEKPHYLVPLKGGDKPYVLLRDTLAKTKKSAIAKVVMHGKQRLVAIFPQEDYLVLEILRFANEVREPHEMDILGKSLDKVNISPRELKSAEGLVDEMTAKWDPNKYKETYRDDLMKLIKSKVKSGKTLEVSEGEDDDGDAETVTKSNVIDLTELLRRSLKSNAKENPTIAKKKRKSAEA